jgi:hypothetical protein
MDELFRNIGAEKTDWYTVLGKMEGYLPIAYGSDRREFFEYLRKRILFIHRGHQVLPFLPSHYEKRSRRSNLMKETGMQHPSPCTPNRAELRARNDIY